MHRNSAEEGGSCKINLGQGVTFQFNISLFHTSWLFTAQAQDIPLLLEMGKMQNYTCFVCNCMSKRSTGRIEWSENNLLNIYLMFLLLLLHWWHTELPKS